MWDKWTVQLLLTFRNEVLWGPYTDCLTLLSLFPPHTPRLLCVWHFEPKYHSLHDLKLSQRQYPLKSPLAISRVNVRGSADTLPLCLPPPSLLTIRSRWDECQSQNYFTAYGHSVSLSWCRAASEARDQILVLERTGTVLSLFRRPL
jgi:hypothetical protein